MIIEDMDNMKYKSIGPHKVRLFIASKNSKEVRKAEIFLEKNWVSFERISIDFIEEYLSPENVWWPEKIELYKVSPPYINHINSLKEVEVVVQPSKSYPCVSFQFVDPDGNVWEPTFCFEDDRWRCLCVEQL